MFTFPEIGTKVTDSDRVDGAVLTVIGVNYANGLVTLELATHAATAPRGRPAEGGILRYRQHMSLLTRTCEWCGNTNMDTEANPNVPELCLNCAPEV